MALTINGIDLLKKYFSGVIERANHHANNVNEIALALIGGVIWRATEDIQVKEYDGAPANILWMVVDSKRYCFSFNHSSGNIEVKENSMKGNIITVFNNTTPISDVKKFFELL